MAFQNRTHKRLVLLVALILAALSVIGAVVFSKAKRTHQNQQQRERVSSIPPVYSKVKNLIVLRATIVDAGTPSAGVAVEIWNDSDKAVMMLDLVCGEGGIIRSGLDDEEHPIVVIKPHGTTIMTMNFGEMTPGADLVVSAVTYADETEEGEESSLKSMHVTRAHDRAQRQAEKERNLQKGAPTP